MPIVYVCIDPTWPHSNFIEYSEIALGGNAGLILVTLHRVPTESWVIAYPVMQVYTIVALEDNSDVGKAGLGRCSVSCICTSAFKLPAMEADPQLAMGPSWLGFCDYAYL